LNEKQIFLKQAWFIKLSNENNLTNMKKISQVNDDCIGIHCFIFAPKTNSVHEVEADIVDHCRFSYRFVFLHWLQLVKAGRFWWMY